MPQHNTMIPAVSASAYDAARHRAAFLDRSAPRPDRRLRHRARVLPAGPADQRHRRAEGGQGCYAAYLTAQGRMIADLYVYELGDVMLLTMTGGVKDAVLAKLDQFIFSEDVQLGDVTATFAQIAVVGPDAARVVASIVGGLSERRVAGAGRARQRARRVERRRGHRHAQSPTPAKPGSICSSSSAQADALKTALAAAGAVELDEATAEAVRIESGSAAVRPRHGRGDDSARGRDRVARDQLHEGLLRRPGSDHPRAASRSRPRRAQAGRADARRRARAGGRRRRSAAARSRDRSGDEQRVRRRRCSGRSRSATCTAIFSSPGRRSASAIRRRSSPRCRS